MYVFHARSFADAQRIFNTCFCELKEEIEKTG